MPLPIDYMSDFNLSVEADLSTEYTSLRCFKEQVVQLGADPDEIAQGLNYDLDSLADPNKPLKHEMYCDLLEAAAVATGCEHFGLLLGQRNDISMLGNLGQLTLNCSNLDEAAKTFIRYFNMVSQAEFFRIETGSNNTFLIREVFLPAPYFSTQAQDISLYEIVKITRSICAENWNPTGVYFTHTPIDQKVYSAAFNCPVYFDQDFQGIGFSNDDLNLQLIRADEASREILQSQVEEVYQENKKSIVEQTQHAITHGMITGDCSIRSVASYLAMNTRTLHRRLEKHETSFTEILEESRKTFSLHFVIKTSISIFDISQMLGYKDSTSLSRSYQRWHGLSPSSHRKKSINEKLT